MHAAFDPYYKWLGIPPEEQPPNYYRLLAIRLFESDADVIGHAADQRMTHVRTFQSGKHAALSQKILNEITAARLCLLSNARKAAYDAELSCRIGPPPVAAAPPGHAGAVGPAFPPPVQSLAAGQGTVPPHVAAPPIAEPYPEFPDVADDPDPRYDARPLRSRRKRRTSVRPLGFVLLVLSLAAMGVGIWCYVNDRSLFEWMDPFGGKQSDPSQTVNK